MLTNINILNLSLKTYITLAAAFYCIIAADSNIVL